MSHKFCEPYWRNLMSYKASSWVLVEVLRAPDSKECRLQVPDGQRCWGKVHQVPPIELYEWIKGFAKFCHKAVNHCHGLLIFKVLTTEEALRAVVTLSITSFVKSFTSVSTSECSQDNKEEKNDGYSHSERSHFSKFPVNQVWWTEQNLILESSVGCNAGSLQEAMFCVIHHGDMVSACCRVHKRFRPVCMCMKQFVSLHSNQTPSFSPNLNLSEVRQRFSTNMHLDFWISS